MSIKPVPLSQHTDAELRQQIIVLEVLESLCINSGYAVALDLGRRALQDILARRDPDIRAEKARQSRSVESLSTLDEK